MLKTTEICKRFFMKSKNTLHAGGNTHLFAPVFMGGSVWMHSLYPHLNIQVCSGDKHGKFARIHSQS